MTTVENGQAARQWRRPRLLTFPKTHPRDFSVLVVLLLTALGIISAWIVFGVKKIGARISHDDDSEEEQARQSMSVAAILVGHFGFAILLLIVLVLLIRRLVYIISDHFRPPKPHSTHSRDAQVMMAATDINSIPPWLRPPLPVYGDVVGTGTGDVEDRFIGGEGLPKYGDNRDSRLLLRSQSRGGGEDTPPAFEAGTVSEETRTESVTETPEASEHPATPQPAPPKSPRLSHSPAV